MAADNIGGAVVGFASMLGGGHAIVSMREEMLQVQAIAAKCDRMGVGSGGVCWFVLSRRRRGAGYRVGCYDVDNGARAWRFLGSG